MEGVRKKKRKKERKKERENPLFPLKPHDSTGSLGAMPGFG